MLKTVTESTPEYDRISGSDIASQKTKDLQQVIDLFKSLKFTGRELKELETFDEVFLALMIIKYHLMLGKQKDYGPGNISKLGPTGIINMIENKVERANNLIGRPDQQVEHAKALLDDLPDDAPANELYNFIYALDKILNPSNAVEGEAIDDTWLDLGNYGDIGYVEHHGAWGKPLQ